MVLRPLVEEKDVRALGMLHHALQVHCSPPLQTVIVRYLLTPSLRHRARAAAAAAPH